MKNEQSAKKRKPLLIIGLTVGLNNIFINCLKLKGRSGYKYGIPYVFIAPNNTISNVKPIKNPTDPNNPTININNNLTI